MLEIFSFSIILFNTNYTIIVLILHIWQHRFILSRYNRKDVIFYTNIFVIYSSSNSNSGARYILYEPSGAPYGSHEKCVMAFMDMAVESLKSVKGGLFEEQQFSLR